MKRLTESQLRQIIREEIINEIKFELDGRIRPQQRNLNIPMANVYDPSASVADPKFRSKPMNKKAEFEVVKFFMLLEKPFNTVKKLLQIDEKDNFENKLIRELNLLKIDYDTSLNRKQKSEYDSKAKVLIIEENGKLYLTLPDPTDTEQFKKIEIKQKQFELMKRLLEQP